MQEIIVYIIIAGVAAAIICYAYRLFTGKKKHCDSCSSCPMQKGCENCCCHETQE